MDCCQIIQHSVVHMKQWFSDADKCGLNVSEIQKRASGSKPTERGHIWRRHYGTSRTQRCWQINHNAHAYWLAYAELVWFLHCGKISQIILKCHFLCFLCVIFRLNQLHGCAQAALLRCVKLVYGKLFVSIIRLFYTSFYKHLYIKVRSGDVWPRHADVIRVNTRYVSSSQRP